MGQPARRSKREALFVHSTGDLTRHIGTDAPERPVAKGSSPSGRGLDPQTAVVFIRNASQCIREDDRDFGLPFQNHSTARIGEREVQDRVGDTRGHAFI